MSRETLAHPIGKTLLAAGIVGAALGAGVALLFAPCAGKEIRKRFTRAQDGMNDKPSNVFEKSQALVLRATWDLPIGGPSVSATNPVRG
jgi:hypothetical protein